MTILGFSVAAEVKIAFCLGCRVSSEIKLQYLV